MDLNYRQTCRTFYTSEVLSTVLFIYTRNTQTQRDVLSQDFARNIRRFLS